MSDAQREIPESLAKFQTAAHREATRAKALLPATDGLASTAVAHEVGVSPSRVVAWWSRFAEEGLAKLGRVHPAQKPGQPNDRWMVNLASSSAYSRGSQGVAGDSAVLLDALTVGQVSSSGANG